MGGVVAALLGGIGVTAAQQEWPEQIVENDRAFRHRPVVSSASIFM
jgi:hypothetical protein